MENFYLEMLFSVLFSQYQIIYLYMLISPLPSLFFKDRRALFFPKFFFGYSFCSKTQIHYFHYI